MLERLFLTLALLVVGGIAYHFFSTRQIRHATALARLDPLLSGIQPGIATILYFTTPMCAPCKTRQAPALDRLQRELGAAIQIIRVDATEQPEAAQRWGVLSVPTTFVIAGNGTTLAVNHGVAETDKLRQQLQVA
jgi:thiol-disulfide isomerase/thioredoxin